jgi:uncharacterized heparinase superfamily protein
MKFHYFDKKINYLKYKKLSVNAFIDKDLKAITYFFAPSIYDTEVNIEDLDFNFVNERVVFNNFDIMNFPGSYYLWSYTFSYMEYLPENIKILLKKYGEKKAIAILMNFLQNWFKSNVISSKPPWYPYAVAKRLEYLIKVYSLIHNNLEKEKTNYFKYLIFLHKILLEDHLETYIGYNHLLQDYKSLILTYLAVNDSNRLFHYMNKYIDQLKLEIDNDGCYIEKTPMYQLQIIIDILDILNASDKISYDKKNIFLEYLTKMANYLFIIEEPNGQLPMINDTSLSYPIDWNFVKTDILEEIKKYRQYIQTDSNIINQNKQVNTLRESGIIVAKTKSFWILSENGSLGAKDIAGHGHADNLMCLLTLINGKKIFVDPGIGSYDKGYYRDLFRSTMMHNTLAIEQRNSSEVWSDFRVGKEAIPIQHDCKENESAIEIYGEVKWVSGEKHKRNISINKKSDTLKIIDKINTITPNERVYVNFILHPDLKYKIINKRILLDNIIEIENSHYDYVVIDKVPYTEFWDRYQMTNRLSFIKEKYNEDDELEIIINKL